MPCWSRRLVKSSLMKEFNKNCNYVRTSAIKFSRRRAREQYEHATSAAGRCTASAKHVSTESESDCMFLIFISFNYKIALPAEVFMQAQILPKKAECNRWFRAFLYREFTTLLLSWLSLWRNPNDTIKQLLLFLFNIGMPRLLGGFICSLPTWSNERHIVLQ